MKFLIQKTDGTPDRVEAELILVKYIQPPIGWDEEKSEPIYGEVTPEEVEKTEWFRAYRVRLMAGDLGNLQQMSISSPWFDSRDESAESSAKREVLGMAVIAGIYRLEP